MPAIAVYATEEDLSTALGGIQPQDDRLKTALVVASAWVRNYVGGDAEPWDVDPEDWTGEWSISQENCTARERQATIAVAVRILKSPDVPWGAAGGLGDVAVYVKNRMPEVELMLLGFRQSWGVA